MYQTITFDIRDYPMQNFNSASTGIEEIDIMNMMDKRLFSLKDESIQKFFYKNSTPLLNADSSSIRPYFELKKETTLNEEILEITIPENMLEFDIVVKMSPKKEWTARMKVKSVEKATPHIVEPEDF